MEDIDVNECCYLINYDPPKGQGNWCGAIHKGACKVYSLDCEYNENCYYKQLKRLEQENKQLKERLEGPYSAKCVFDSHCQQYECQVIKNDIAFDGCLWTELNMLWLDGIETIGSCCGHHIDGGIPYIQVKKEYEKDMIENGYQPFENEYGNILFKPKTIFL